MQNSSKKSKVIPTSAEDRSTFSSVRNEINKIVNNLNNFGGWFEPFKFPIEHFENISILPAVDIVDDKEQFKVEVEMPGIGIEDVKVSIENGLLNIKAEKSTSKEDKSKNYRTREINYGFYERSISLPDGIDIAEAKASFKKGMLWVKIPKKIGKLEETQEIKVEKLD